MKILELEIEENMLEELQINTFSISYRDLRKKIARAEANKALDACLIIAEEEGLNKISEDELQNLVKDVRAGYDKSGN